MARRATGRVVEDTRGAYTVYALRFPAYGKRRYVTLGSAADGWTRERAEAELRHVMADVERGIWRPPAPAPVVELREDETFHEFASRWWQAKRRELKSETDYKWRLTDHLLPFLKDAPMSSFSGKQGIRLVDAYREHKVAEGNLSPASIDKALTLLRQILEAALEEEVIDRNPMRVNPKRRRLRVRKAQRRYLDRAEQITALLDAAGDLDREARPDRRNISRRALLAVLVFGGLRITEALALRWRDVDLPGGRLRLQDAKTDAGVRDAPILPALRDELLAYKAACTRIGADELVFATRNGRPLTRDNTRQRVLAKAIERADERLEAAGHVPLPEGLTQHGLRHTYISLRLALGHDLAVVAQDAGHADISVTYRIYTHVMRLGEADRAALAALVDGVQIDLARASVLTGEGAA
jgi:integrase